MKGRVRNICFWLGLSLLPSHAWSIAIDGVFAPGDNYSNVFSVTYKFTDLPNMYGGSLALGQDDDGQYLYFAAPIDFVDNSYGVNSIGWGGHTHTFDELIKSDLARFNFVTRTGDVEATIDYLAQTNPKQLGEAYGSCGVKTGDPAAAGPIDADFVQQCDGVADPAAQAIIIDVASSQEYNMLFYSDGPVDVLTDSPYADETYNNVQAGYEGWQFDLAYEIWFAPNTFDPLLWASADPNVISDLIQILEPHASPSKTNVAFPDEVCIGGADGCPEPPPPRQVPAPGALALMLLGLAGLRRHHSRRRQG